MIKKLILASVLCASTACAQTEKPAPAPVANSPAPLMNMPAPPRQNAPWAHGGDAFSVAVATLFEQGLADPRGLEYREIEIRVGNPWNGGGDAMTTHGWVLPHGAENERFAVAYNGLIYPVVKVGALADVRADWAPDAKKPTRGYRSFDQTSEGSSVNFAGYSDLKMAMLWRLGETELVKRLRPDSSHVATAGDPKTDPYLNLATDWAWFAFERAVCAHERGDDELTLTSAQLLTRIEPLIDAEAKRRGFAQRNDESNSRFRDRKLPYLPFLKQLPTLLRDAQRRVGANIGGASKPEIGENASVAQLIEDLENVDERQWGQPGGVSLAQDKRVQALVKRGNVVVEPLLNTLENDERLTRSVSFGRNFFRDRHLISVAETADAALTDLLRVRFQGYDDNGEPLSRARRAQQIRVYWQKMGDKSPAERFYATLQDDRAGTDQWMQAAANLVQPTDVESHGGWTTIPDRKPNQKIELRGEKLRDGRAPSVAQLLAKRSDDIAAIRTGSSNDVFLFINAAEMALALADWDKTEALPVLTRRLARAYSIGAQPNDILLISGNPAERFGGIIAKMTLARARAGDVAAYDEYAKWITHADLNFSFGAEDLQKPLIQGAARPSIGRAIEYLFNDPKSPWSNIFAPLNGSWRREFWSSPLALTRGFRKQALRGLSDKSAGGTIIFNARKDWDSQTEAQIEYAGSSISFRGSAGDAATPPPGQKRAFRVCDAWAYFYAQNQGGPKIQLFWPQPKRDAAVAACRRWLTSKK